MPKHISELPAKHNQAVNKVASNRPGVKHHRNTTSNHAPNSRERWAEVLATADRYF